MAAVCFFETARSTSGPKRTPTTSCRYSRVNIQTDSFTSFLNGVLLDIYHRVWGHRKQNRPEYREYNDKKIAGTSTVIVTVLASAMPAVTVLVLYFVRRLLVRIGLMIVFTTLFSLALAIFSTADKATIFTATAT